MHKKNPSLELGFWLPFCEKKADKQLEALENILDFQVKKSLVKKLQTTITLKVQSS